MKEISTITVNDIIPEATKAVQKFIKGTSKTRTLPHFGSHYTLEDLVMDAVEKVVAGNPKYLTKTYVWMAAKWTCIDLMGRKKLPWGETLENIMEEGEVKTSAEESIIGDQWTDLVGLEEYLEQVLTPETIEVYHQLLTGKMYVEIAEDMGISMSTLERRVHNLKYVVEFLVTEEDPQVYSRIP